jgi:hypothetical protein
VPDVAGFDCRDVVELTWLAAATQDRKRGKRSTCTQMALALENSNDHAAQSSYYSRPRSGRSAPVVHRSLGLKKLQDATYGEGARWLVVAAADQADFGIVLQKPEPGLHGEERTRGIDGPDWKRNDMGLPR